MALRFAKHNRVPQVIGVGTGSSFNFATTTHGSAIVDGDAAQLGSLIGLIAPVDAAFPIVTL